MDSIRPRDLYLGTALRCCVYGAVSDCAAPEFWDAARKLGTALGAHGIEIRYGGSGEGPMGALATAAIDTGGTVVGVIPRFMDNKGWSHNGLTELELVDDMHERKRRMVHDVDAVIGLPGGTGTLEELLEFATWKRLGLVAAPLILLNIGRFFDPLSSLLAATVDAGFMEAHQLEYLTLIESPDDVIDALRELGVGDTK